MIIIGHRGARGHAPENTLLGIDTGLRMGVDWVEFDVQLHHASGELIVLHDLTLERTTNGRGYIQDWSYADLRTLDAGQGQFIPNLDEVLTLIDGRVGINIELKTGDGTGEAVAALLRRYITAGLSPEKLLVSSFHLPELWEFKQLAPEIPVAPLLCGVPLDWAGCAVELGAACLNLSAEFAEPRLIVDAQSHGMKVLVYTVNDPDEMTRLRRLGVDGFFTDFPDRALALRAATV